MNITVTKVENPYNISFDLSSGINDVISGDISIGGTKYFLDIVSKDILNYLKEVIDSKYFDALFSNLERYNNILPETINDIPEQFRRTALEVKLKLMACKCFQGIDNESKRKLEALQRYHQMKDDETNRHERGLREIEKWLSSELAIEEV